MPFDPSDDPYIGELTKYLANIDPQKIRQGQAFQQLGSLIGGPAGQLGNTIGQNTSELLKEGTASGRAMMHYAPQAEEMRQKQEMLNSPQAGKVLRGAISAIAPQVGPDLEGASPRVLMGLLPTLKEAGQAWKIQTDWMGNPKFKYNIHTGEIQPLGGGGAGGVGGAGGGEDLVAKALAKQLHDTGQLAQGAFGFGKFGEMRRRRVFSEFANMYGPEAAAQAEQGMANPEQGVPDLANAAMKYKAGVKTVDTLAPLVTKLDAAERTAGANLDAFIQAASKLQDLKSPLFNQALYAFQYATGDSEVAAMRTAHAVAAPEVARVLVQLGGSGVLAESARKEISDLLDPNATMAQKLAAAKQLRQDFNNRRKAYHDELNGLMGNKGLPSTTGGNFGVPSNLGVMPTARDTDGRQIRRRSDGEWEYVD